MKSILLIALPILFTSSLQAQKKASNSVSKSINDDGKRLTLTIDASCDDCKIYFTNTYNVEGWNQKQKDALVKRISDSLSLPKNRRVVKI